VLGSDSIVAIDGPSAGLSEDGTNGAWRDSLRGRGHRLFGSGYTPGDVKAGTDTGDGDVTGEHSGNLPGAAAGSDDGDTRFRRLPTYVAIPVGVRAGRSAADLEAPSARLVL